MGPSMASGTKSLSAESLLTSPTVEGATRTSFLVDKIHKRQPVGSVGEDVRFAFERVADRTHVIEDDAGHRAETHRVDWTVAVTRPNEMITNFRNSKLMPEKRQRTAVNSGNVMILY